MDARVIFIHPQMSKWFYHRVKSGDTLGKIARMYGTTVNELCRLNGLKGTSMLRIGQSIRCSAGVEPRLKATPKAQTQKKSTASGSSKKITVQAKFFRYRFFRRKYEYNE